MNTTERGAKRPLMDEPGYMGGLSAMRVFTLTPGELDADGRLLLETTDEATADPRGGSFEPDQWDTALMELVANNAEHVTFGVYRAPEGLIARSFCAHCGGLAESLMERVNDDPFVTVPAAVREAVAFADRHESCELGLDLKMAIDEETEQWVRKAMYATEETLGCGEQTMPLLMIEVEKGDVEGGGRDMMAVPLGDMPNRTPDDPTSRGIAFASLKAGIRKHLRDSNQRARRVLHVSEAWATAMDPSMGELSPTDARRFPAVIATPSRIEVLMVVVATTERCLMMFGEIVREGGVKGVGPGRVKQWKRGPIGEMPHLISGLMAQPHVWQHEQQHE